MGEFPPKKAKKIVPSGLSSHTYSQMQPVDDGALLRQYAENQSNDAFAMLVARHVNLVYSVALRNAGDPHHAAEITQAVFIILAKKALQLRHDKALSSWLFQATRLTASNFLRSEIRRHHREQEAYMQSALNESGGDEVWPQIALLLDSAVATLNEKDRRAIVLRFYQGRSLREVGAALGGNEESAKKRVARALEKLQRFFSRCGVNSTTTLIAGAISGNSVLAAPPALAVSITAAATAKGAATSVSTLTLVKGALKVMAWTKAKKAAVTGGLALVIAGVGIVAFNAFDSWRISRFPDIQGTWEGTSMFWDGGVRPGQAARSHVVLTLVKKNGAYTATTDWIELGRKNLPMGKVTYDYPYLSFQRSPRSTWKLRINADATQMVLDDIGSSRGPVLFLRDSSPDTVPAPLTEEEFAPGDGSGLQGYWEGEFDLDLQYNLSTGGTKPGKDAVPVNLKISDQGNGKFRAEIGVPEYGLDRLPATGSYKDSLIKFSDNIQHGLFQGAMSDNGTELIGSFTTGGQSVPAKFKRTDFRAAHALDDKKDYSFNSPRDLQGHWKGFLPTPKGKPWVPFVVDIAKMPDGSWSSTLTITDSIEARDPMPASDTEFDPPNVRLKWKWWQFAYEGTLNNGKLVGVWTGPNKLRRPLTFGRTTTQ
jgi:RNA polymerase sigma factor (sigma-70 family)